MDLNFEIKDQLGILSEGSKGWAREVNLVSWNGRDAKIDIRDWDPSHEKMGKGITLSDEEAKKLIEILKSRV